MSDQILKKMEKSDGKKKQNMNQTDINNLYLVRVGSLAITGHVHEANSLMSKNIVKQDKNSKLQTQQMKCAAYFYQ